MDVTEKLNAEKKIAFNGEPQPVGRSTQLDLLTQNCRGAAVTPGKLTLDRTFPPEAKSRTCFKKKCHFFDSPACQYLKWQSSIVLSLP